MATVSEYCLLPRCNARIDHAGGSMNASWTTYGYSWKRGQRKSFYLLASILLSFNISLLDSK